ncbi:MAG: glutamine amidotransferase [Gimesia sp.]
MKPILEPIWSWPVMTLIIIALISLVLITYPKRVKHLSPLLRRLLIGLRLFTVFVLVFMLLRPAIELTDKTTRQSWLYILADSSRSMQTEDGPGSTTRRNELVKTLISVKTQFDNMDQNIGIKRFDFSKELTPVEEYSEDANGEQTAIGYALDSISSQLQQEKLVGILLLSDGAERALPPYDIDTRSRASYFGDSGIPIYTIGFGSSNLKDTSLDLVMESLVIDPLVFEKKTTPINVKVRSLGAQNRDLTIRLLVEDRTNKKIGEAGEMKPAPAYNNSRVATQIHPTQNNELTSVELFWTPEIPGEYKIAVEVVPLEGEIKQTNNRLETIVTVQKGGVQVVYFDSLRPEQKFIRSMNDPKIQLDYIPVGNGFSGGKIPQNLDLSKYDVFLIGDVPADLLGPKVIQQISSRIKKGAGLLMTGGYRSFGPGGYAGTALDKFIPVQMRASEKQIGNNIAKDLHYFQDLKMIPTTLGLKRYVMQLENSAVENQQTWNSLAPLKGANRLRKKHDLVEILAQSAGNEAVPLLFGFDFGNTRVMAFAGDTTFQWFLSGNRAEHERFWRQLILWLAHKENDSGQGVWTRVNTRNISPGARVPIQFGAKDSEDQPISNVKFTVRVTGPSGKPTQVEIVGTGDSASTTFSETMEPGDYWVTVHAEKDGVSLGFDATTRFIVDPRDLELDNPAADYSLLESISSLSGGTTLPPEELESFLTRMNNDKTWNNDLIRYRRIPLWDNWYFLALFVFLLTAEWFLRKHKGLV